MVSGAAGMAIYVMLLDEKERRYLAFMVQVRYSAVNKQKI